MNSFWYRGELHDGSTLSLSVNEPGLLFGATVFTTLRVYGDSLDHPLTAWSDHCDRLQTTLQSFRWTSPDWQQVRTGAECLREHHPILRITLFPDGTELITGRPLPENLSHQHHTGITAWLDEDAQFSRSLPAHKTGNYLAPWLALQTAQRQGAEEAILTDPNSGNWLETSTGNLWGWADGCWWTPPLTDAILPGIGRSHLISRLKWQNRGIREHPWIPQQVSTFDAIAYSNCVRQVVPIHTVLTSRGTQHFDAQHPRLQELQSLYTENSMGTSMDTR